MMSFFKKQSAKKAALASPKSAYEYARNVVQGRFPLAEPAFANTKANTRDADCAQWYYTDIVIKASPFEYV